MKTINKKPTGLKNFYEINKWYSFTLNPQDKYQFFGNEYRFKRFRNIIYELFLVKYHYGFIIEISEPRNQIPYQYKGPRLHIHGTIRFPTRATLERFLIIKMSQISKIGTMEIDTIGNIETWLDYIHKQNILMGDTYIGNYLQEDYYKEMAKLQLSK